MESIYTSEELCKTKPSIRQHNSKDPFNTKPSLNWWSSHELLKKEAKQNKVWIDEAHMYLLGSIGHTPKYFLSIKEPM